MTMGKKHIYDRGRKTKAAVRRKGGGRTKRQKKYGTWNKTKIGGGGGREKKELPKKNQLVIRLSHGELRGLKWGEVRGD